MAVVFFTAITPMSVSGSDLKDSNLCITMVLVKAKQSYARPLRRIMLLDSTHWFLMIKTPQASFDLLIFFNIELDLQLSP